MARRPKSAPKKIQEIGIVQNGHKSKKLKTKKKKGSDDGGSLSGNSKKSLHQLYHIVPWASRNDWNRVAELFNAEDYEGVIQEILIWRERVPALPVGVEATLFLFQALVYDDPAKEPLSEEQSRSLYSLAVIRYLNHVSHLATKEMGGSGLPMFKLASHVSVPDWIVNLRHEASHGIALPSLEILRLAAAFIKSWLKANYWLPSTSPAESNVLSAQTSPQDEDKLYNTASEIISAYIACRIYTSRHCVTIADSDVTKHMPNQPKKVRTKAATGELKIKILNLFSSSQFLASCAIAQEMIPQPDFYNEFSTLFRNNPFGELLNVWSPLLKLLSKKGKLISICTQLAEVHVDTNSAENAQHFSALWLDNLLERIDAKGNDASQTLTRRILPIVMNAPNSHSKIFLNRLLKMVETTVGTAKVRQLDELASIWMDEDNSAKNSTRRKGEGSSKLFTVEEISHPKQTERSDGGSQEPNYTDQTRVWSKIRFGTFLNSGTKEF